jgi:hypothetical protein
LTRRFLIDAVERIGATAAEAALGALIAAGAFNAKTGQAALVAGLTAAASAVKALAARYVGSRDSASLAPSIGPTPAFVPPAPIKAQPAKKAATKRAR